MSEDAKTLSESDKFVCNCFMIGSALLWVGLGAAIGFPGLLIGFGVSALVVAIIVTIDPSEET
jgi:hypothetical protein